MCFLINLFSFLCKIQLEMFSEDLLPIKRFSLFSNVSVFWTNFNKNNVKMLFNNLTIVLLTVLDENAFYFIYLPGRSVTQY